MDRNLSRLSLGLVCTALMLVALGCSKSNNTLQSNMYRQFCAKPGTAFDSRPARRQTFIGFDRKQRLEMDDGIQDEDTDDTYARAAHYYAREADDFFVQLRLEGFGDWSGCYDEFNTQTPIMKSGVQPGRTDISTGWQLDHVVYYKQDEAILPQAAYHEWAHGLIFSTVKWNSPSPSSCGDGCLPGQTDALFESVPDVFAAVRSGRYEMGSDQSRRSMADPQAYGDPDTFGAYVLTNLGPLCHRPDVFCKYQNAGIPNKAAYLMIEGTLNNPVDRERYGDLQALGKDKVARIYFHALQPEFLGPTPTFQDFANGVVNACLDLSKPDAAYRSKPQVKVAISAADCINVAAAFQAVRMLQSSAIIRATVPHEPTVAPTPEVTKAPPPTVTPVQPLVQRLQWQSERGSDLRVFNHTQRLITIHELKCRITSEKAAWARWEDDDIEPGQESEVLYRIWANNSDCQLDILSEGVSPLRVLLGDYVANTYFEVHVRETDLK